MPKRFIRFNLPSDGDKKALFFNKERSNFLVIVEKRVFYLHKEFLSPSEFFTELIKENKNSVTINIHLNVQMLVNLGRLLLKNPGLFLRY